MFYPATLTKENERWTVTFRNIPEVITCDDDLQDALNMAQDALIASMDHRTVPLPSKAKKGEYLIDLPASLFAKALLLNEIITNIERAKRINAKPQEVQRIVNLNHSTKIDTISKALSASGKHLELKVA
ncbi:type II toxin-antitoxin system HicB family antitoxin [Gilliamella apicola]|uniref:type II toxin-antitoxin system HicB family antitoxin n=1 Tax=Gilliamella apicola TaxID=1196095 RepID=UPI0039872F9D